MTRSHVLAFVLAMALGAVGAARVNLESTWGWDESTNVGMPARRIALAIERGEPSAVARVAVECQQYPFVWPAVLGLAQTVIGSSEAAARRSTRLLWGLGLFALFLLAHRLAPDDARAAPWIALALGATSPLALAYSGSLFLEVPFLVASLFALHAWLGRGPDRPLASEFLAGTLCIATFFTKFNYGVLFCLGLALAWGLEVAVEVRAGRGRNAARHAAALLAIPVLALVWWFVIPWPAGPDMAASHRTTILEFLSGNRDPSMRTAPGLRPMHWGAYLVRSPRWLVLLALGLVMTLGWLRRAPVRLLWIVFLTSALPVALHPFHLDRFLLPAAGPLWVLAAFGLSRLARTRTHAVIAAALLPLLWVAPSWDAWWLARRVGLANEELRDYQLEVIASWADLSPSRRLDTNGLSRSEHDGLVGLIADAVDDGDRVGWVGMSQKFSPAAMHMGLMARGRPPSPAFLAGRLERSFITIGVTDPGWDDAKLRGWAEGFDVLLMTRPVDLFAHPSREFLGAYQVALVESGVWKVTEIGRLNFSRPKEPPHEVTLYSLTR